MQKPLLISLLLLTGCAFPGFNNIHDGLTRVEWDYMQAVGGIRLGEPYVNGDFLYIPLEHDFTGRTTITTLPTVIGSTFECVYAELNGVSGNLLATEIDISLWGAERGTWTRGRIPFNCNEVQVPLFSLYVMGPSIFYNARVMWRDTGLPILGLNRYEIGDFSL